MAGLDISNRMFYYEGIGDCKIELNFEKHTIEVYTSTSPDCVDILNEFGFGYTFLKLSKYSSYLDWLNIPKELPLGTLVVASNNKEFWSIGTYERNQRVTITFPKRTSEKYQYIVPYSSFNLVTGEFPESENYGCAKKD